MALFVLINSLLLTLLYWFLSSQGFTLQSFIIASLMFLLASLVSGYIVISDLLDHKQSQDDRLSHITREVLHEINLPLSTIDANTKMLYRSVSDERDKKRLSRIDAASVRLRRLYKELSYSLKKEILPIEKEKFDLADLMRDRVSQIEELGRNRFVLSLESTPVEVDRIGLEQAVDNIIENAMKYSDIDDPVVISLQGSVLRIEDHGIGIDANQLLHIYERYYQGNRGVAGEGIGLALVKRYCDEQSIELKISSQVESGTIVEMDFFKVLNS